jgi:hypothetical protein
MNARHLLLEDFLPLRLLGRIHGDEGRRPAAVHFPAAVIFIDVSRYTALVEQLARRGREGLEELPRLLSLSYGRCSEYVADLGGEVLYFAGDSLLAYWAAEADQLGSAVRSAVDCAGMICRNGHDRGHRGVTEISPALHIGIGAGRLWAAALGDQPVWNLVAGGKPSPRLRHPRRSPAVGTTKCLLKPNRRWRAIPPRLTLATGVESNCPRKLLRSTGWPHFCLRKQESSCFRPTRDHSEFTVYWPSIQTPHESCMPNCQL